MLKMMNALFKIILKVIFKKSGNFSVLANVHTPNIGKRAHLLQNFWQTFTLFLTIEVSYCYSFTQPFNV